MKRYLLGAIGIYTLSFASATVQAALVGRLPATSGGTDYQAYYDTALNITWMADANLAATKTFGTAGVNAGGYMTWATANSWIANMNAANYLGFNDWRLPVTAQPDPTCGSQTAGNPPQGYGLNCTGSEIGHLYNVDGVTVATPGPFSHIQSSMYWGGTVYAPNPTYVWGFRFGHGGEQTAPNKDLNAFVWAVRTGDVTAVPVPAAMWLFGSGLIGLLGMARRTR